MGRKFGIVAVALMALGAGCYIGAKFKKPDRVEEVGFLTKESSENNGIYGLRLRMYSDKEFLLEFEKPLYMAPGQEVSGLETHVVEGYARSVKSGLVNHREEKK